MINFINGLVNLAFHRLLYGYGNGCGLAMAGNLVGENPIQVTTNHGPGIEPCRFFGNEGLDA